MSDDTINPQVDRGKLLRWAGLAALGVAVPWERTTGAWAGLTRPVALKELRVGNLLTLSGPNSAPALDVKRGFVTYVKAHNNRLAGRKVHFFDGDDAADPATGIRQAQKLVNDNHVDVIEGIFYSSVLLGVRDTINSLKVPTIVANAAANAITRDRRSAYIFRTSYTNHQLGASLATWAAKKVTKSGLVVVAANYAAGHESSDAFKKIYERKGGKVAATIFTPFPTTPDYQPYLSRVQDEGAKAVWAFAAGGGESIKFVKQYQQFGLKGRIPLIGINNLTDPQSVLGSQGDAAMGIRTSANWAPTLKNAQNKKFLAAYRRFYGTPSAFAELGYVAAAFLDHALDKVHGNTSNKARFLRAMAQAGSFQTPGGTLKMDPRTHQVILPFYLRRVVKSKGQYRESLIGNLGRFTDPGGK